MQKLVLVEINDHGDPVRILRFRKQALYLPVETVREWPRADAVRMIRHTVYRRSKDENLVPHCEWCGSFITWETGHMHEVLPRGKGGEISIENSVFICPDCHINTGHGDRKWQSAKLKDE